MDPIIILQAGVATGTILLFATIGEIFAERSGVMNLGVEGMMLIGAMTAFSTAIATGNPWLGLLAAMLAAGLLSQIHAFISITLQGDQVVSGLGSFLPRHWYQPGIRRGIKQSWNRLPVTKLYAPASLSNPNHWTNLIYESERACLHRVSINPHFLVLH